MRIIAVLIVMLLLFGCNGQEPVEPVKNETNKTTNETVKIIIGEQENQTSEGNFTKTEENKTDENVTQKSYEYEPDLPLGVYFIYVGDKGLQGDAILIKKGDFDVLVDAGPAEKSAKVIDFLRARSVDDIELLISTNADPRHYGGINSVADSFDIEELWWSGQSFDDANYLDVINRVKAEAKKTETVSDGFSFEGNGISFKVLNPPTRDRFSDFNNDAIVTLVKDRNFSMLLTSGIQSGAQGRLVNQKTAEIKQQIIQAPYYGSGVGTSNIGIFLVTAKPETIMISGSADESPENGGSRDPFRMLMRQYGIKWYENYVNGTIRITSDGETYAIQSLGNN